MTNSPLVDGSLGGGSAALDFDFGERRESGVVFHRPSTVRVDASPNNDNPADGANVDGYDINDARDTKDSAPADGASETIMLPHSTHSLLFTERVLSPPFAFALSVLLVLFTCLSLSLWDNLSGGTPGNPLNVPVNVSYQVRIAQCTW